MIGGRSSVDHGVGSAAFMTRLLLAHKSDLMLDEAIMSASAAIVRTLETCAAAAARQDGDREWLRRFAWFTERTVVPLH